MVYLLEAEQNTGEIEVLPAPEPLAVAGIDGLEMCPNDHSGGVRALMKRKMEENPHKVVASLT